MLVGAKREELRRSGLPSGPKAVASIFARLQVRGHYWRNERLSGSAVEKMLLVYEHISNVLPLRSIVCRAYREYGSDSPFEDYSILHKIIFSCTDHRDLHWILSTMLYQKAQFGEVQFSYPDLFMQVSPIHIYRLRRMFVIGMLYKYIDPVIATRRELAAAGLCGPGSVKSAIEFKLWFLTVDE